MTAEFRSFRESLLLRRDRRLSIVVLESVGSTNALARRIVRRGWRAAARTPDFAVVAWSQTAGYGRYGRPWVSPGGDGVWATLVLGSVGVEKLALLPLRAGVVLQGLLQPYSNEPIRLKWPNDLLIGSAKVGGLLAEAVTRGRRSCVVLGVGINCGLEAPAVEDRPVTSLGSHCRVLPSLTVLTSEILVGLYDELQSPVAGNELIDRIRGLSTHRPGDSMVVQTRGGAVNGLFREISAVGALVLETADGVRAFDAGEVVSA